MSPGGLQHQHQQQPGFGQPVQQMEPQYLEELPRKQMYSSLIVPATDAPQ